MIASPRAPSARNRTRRASSDTISSSTQMAVRAAIAGNFRPHSTNNTAPSSSSSSSPSSSILDLAREPVEVRVPNREPALVLVKERKCRARDGGLLRNTQAVHRLTREGRLPGAEPPLEANDIARLERVREGTRQGRGHRFGVEVELQHETSFVTSRALAHGSERPALRHQRLEKTGDGRFVAASDVREIAEVVAYCEHVAPPGQHHDSPVGLDLYLT